jgi:lipoic acid synthetase
MVPKNNYIRKPEWLKIRLPRGEEFAKVNSLIKNNQLHTICTSGNCPNHADCWERGTATLMILGDTCTRSCKFCNVTTGKPLPADWSEPLKIAQTVKDLKLKHCVLTSVDRDDLSDGGAEIWAETIRQVKRLNSETTMETLIPDFDGKYEHIHKVIEAAPEVISHNLETVRRLTPDIRSRAKYDTSLQVIRYISESGLVAKSGIMLGLGETREEILQTMDDLLAVGCKVFTIGQYLQPTRENYPVKEYITPETFAEYEKIGLEKGFRFVESGPLVRSSYHAEKHAPARIQVGKWGK